MKSAEGDGGSAAPRRSAASPDEPAPSDLAGRVWSGVGWKAASGLVRAAWRLAVVVTLARLLGPADFGLAAMALVLSAFVVPLADLGLGTALVQRRTLEERERSTVFWLSVAAGVALSALGVALAGLVADFYGRHELQLLFAALSLSFVITSLGTVQRSELVRKMDFRALELRTIAGVMVGGVVAIVLASLGYGAWALIGQELAIAAVSTCLLWLLIPWRPRFLFSGRSARELGGYGLSVLGGSFFVGLNQNADNLIVGRFLGASALGLYSVAYSVILAPLTRIVDPAQQVLFSALARIQDDRNHVVRAWKRMVRLLAVICMPMMLGFVVVAPDVVPAVLGSRWTDAVPVFQILACVSVVQCLQRPVAAILQAVNLPRMYLVLSAAGFVINLAAFFVGLRWGVVGVAAAFAVTSTLVALAYFHVAAQALGVSALSILRSAWGVAQASIAMAVLVFAERQLLLAEHVSTGVRVLIVVITGICVFGVLCVWRAPEAAAELRLIGGRIKGLRPRIAASSPVEAA